MCEQLIVLEYEMGLHHLLTGFRSAPDSLTWKLLKGIEILPNTLGGGNECNI